MRSERDPQIVLSSVEEVHFVAYVKAQTKWSPEALETHTRIEREAGISVCNAVHRPHKPNAILAGIAKVHKAKFAGRKSIEVSFAELELRTEQSGQRPEAGCIKSGGQAIVSCETVVAREIVSHFSFNTRVRIYIEAKTSTHANKVRDIFLVKPEVFCERSELDMVFSLCDRHPRGYDQERKNCKESNTFHISQSPKGRAQISI